MGVKHGVNPGELLATEEAIRIYRLLISRMAENAHTGYGRLKMESLFPSSSPSLIEENRKLALDSMDDARMLEGKGLEGLLSRIKPLRKGAQARIRERAIVVDSPETLQELRSRGLDRLIDIRLVESPRELRDVVVGYSHVCMVGSSSFDAERAESMEDWYLVPEAVLGYFRENLETLLSASKAARMLQDAKVRSFEGLEELEKLFRQLETGEDEEAIRLGALLQRLGGCVNDSAAWANAELKRRIEASSVTLGGMDLLQALGRGEGVREIFEIQMRGVFQDVLKEARARAANSLGVIGPEAARLAEVFPSEIRYPLVLDKQALRVFEQELRSRREARSLRARRELAKGLADKKEMASRMVAELMEFDFCYALGRFALEEGLRMPEMVDEPCLGFQDGRNLSLESPELVSYSLGDTGLAPCNERVALLSGVNSGGKTSLLDLIAQIAILAQMGLPVPALRSRTCIFQEIYYFSKGRGTLSAGAFETAMRKFAALETARRKLVLADELESITEPGASARIIACMLDELNRSSVAVFVSHLAGEVRRLTETPVRIDGIEAAGLDAENNLVVRRSPRYNFLARSTPELILDRLVRTASGAEREFYSRLLARFR
jgi:dsDNA-specific endonuclease/ATPase MutS2